MTEPAAAQHRIQQANARYAADFPGAPDKAPALRLAVLACMDARLVLPDALGLRIGEAHLLRNAGGLVTDDVLRSLAISQRLLGTHEVAVVQHTDCGMFGFDDDEFRAELQASGHQAPGWDVPGFTDLSESVRQSVRQIVQCLWLPHRDSVQGYLFDVQTGELSAVD
jgi:carbonic anhydrase